MWRRWTMQGALVLLAVPAGPLAQTTREGGGAADTRADSVREVSASELLPLAERSRTFLVVEGDGQGQHVALTLRRGERQDGGEGFRWQLQLDDFNTLYLIERPDGAVVIERLDVATERETVLYDPPVTLLPATIVPDESWEESGNVKVWDWDEERFEHQGQYQHRVLPVSKEQFSTPAGEFEGFMISIEQTVDVRAPASIRLWFDSGFVPGEGLVKRSSKIVIDKPAWFGQTTRRTVELAR